MEDKTVRLWKPIKYPSEWVDLDTSTIDDISPSWFERREDLQEKSQEYRDFLQQLKREHAIETGIVERMYELDQGVTETLISKGFSDSYIDHNDTNIGVPKLLKHLNDHLDAVDFVFDIIKNNRPVTSGFIKELHALVTRNQEHAEGRDQFGNKTQVELLSGKYKERENNPTRSDGTSIMYCPPEHVASEMDNLISFYEQAESEGVHPIIISAWFHHAFSTIHPFQDGNGRVVRLMSSLILIKHDLFPFTVLRKDAKEKYIDALEKADQGEFQGLVDYFASVQKRHIEKVLNLKKFSSSSFEQVTDIFNGKLEEWQNKKEKERQKLLDKTREEVFQYGVDYVNQISTKLRNKTQGKAEFYIDKCPPKGKNQDYYQGQIIKYAKKHDYFFNRNYPKSWILLKIDIPEDKSYQLGISFHHYGYDDNTLAIGAFLEYLNKNSDNDRIDAALPLEIKPHIISISQGTQVRQKNIERFLEDVITIALAQIANEL